MKLGPPRDLTLPEPGSRTAYGVLSRAIGRLVAEVRPLVVARTGGAIGAETAEIGVIASALRRPNAGALARAMRGAAPEERERLAAELVATIALEATLSGALARDVVVRSPPKTLLSIAHRARFDLPDDAAAITFASRGSIVHRSRGSGDSPLDAARAESPYHELASDIVFARADNNPLAMLEAHPDKSGNAIDLGGQPPSRWVGALREALGLVERHMPDVRREMDLFSLQIVPVGYDDEKHLSASYQEAIGSVYMSLHPNPLTMAEALVHEFSHNKLNALFEIDPVLENAFSSLYASPLRPDPRPLHGVLLAAHALVPMATLNERVGNVDGLRKNAKLACEAADAIVAHGKPTPIGRGVIEELARQAERLRRFGSG